jgi:hypothetical protein
MDEEGLDYSNNNLLNEVIKQFDNDNDLCWNFYE